MSWLDLNADLGEGVGDDEAMLDIVSSASIACGGHAGDEDTMRATVRAAKARGVVIGAHPGFADRENFGRRRLVLPPEELDASIRAAGAHAGRDRRGGGLAGALREAARRARQHGGRGAGGDGALPRGDRGAGRTDMAILAIDNSAQVEVAEALGFRTIREAYADRAYQPDGLLVPRQMPGAVLHDPAEIAERAVRLAQQRRDRRRRRHHAQDDGPVAVHPRRYARCGGHCAGGAGRPCVRGG